MFDETCEIDKVTDAFLECAFPNLHNLTQYQVKHQ